MIHADFRERMNMYFNTQSSFTVKKSTSVIGWNQYSLCVDTAEFEWGYQKL